MSSLFDSRVYFLRNSIPFVRPNLLTFLKEAALDSCSSASLTVEYRHAVSTRLWWELNWMDPKGNRRHVASQEFDLLAWRAIEVFRQYTRQQTIEARPGNDYQDGGGI